MANPLKMLKLKPTSFQFIQELKINAPTKRVWDSLIDVRGWFKFDPTAKNTDRKLELWPGGRFHNESPDGTQSLYAIVTHIEPGKLLRLHGQMGNTHLPMDGVFIFELQERKPAGTLLRFCQRTFGLLDADVAKKMKGGWGKLLPQIKEMAEKKRK
ncbi:MAG: SRPBCC domain-containing protein [Anaerolineae bacterium]|nr:SRPBCC domain-containing protein [Phycisphaerae bacterium]